MIGYVEPVDCVSNHFKELKMKNHQTTLRFVKLATLLTMLMTSFVQASPTSIPAEFIGHWESKPADCHLVGDAKDFSNHININKAGYEGFEFGCKAIKTTSTSKGAYIGKMSCSGAGDEPSVNTISFHLQMNNRLKITQKSGKQVYVNQYVKCTN